MAQVEEPGLVDTVTDAVSDSMPGQIADTLVDTGREVIGGGEQAPAEPGVLAEDAPWYTQLYHEQMIPMYQEYLAPFVDMIPWAGIFAAGLTLFFVIGGMNEIASGRG